MQELFENMCNSLNKNSNLNVQIALSQNSPKKRTIEESKSKNSQKKLKTSSNTEQKATTKNIAQLKLEEHMKKLEMMQNKEYKKSTSKKFVFMLTGIDDESKEEMKKKIKKMGASISEEMDSKITHVVCNVNQTRIVSGRTIKYVWGVLKSLWVVSVDCIYFFISFF